MPRLGEITAHERRVFDGYAEAQTLDLVDVGHIFEERGHHQIGAAVGYRTAEGVEIGKLPLVIAAGAPFQGVQIHRVGDPEILEGTKQLAVNGFGQPDLRGNSVV